MISSTSGQSIIKNKIDFDNTTNGINLLSEDRMHEIENLLEKMELEKM